MRLQCNGVFRSVIGAEVLVMLRLPESRCVHEIFVGTDHQRILHQSHCLMMLLPAPAPKEPMQGVRGREHLRAPAHQEPMQGVGGRGHLRAPPHQEPMQGVRGGGHLRAPARKEQMQGVRGGGHLRAPPQQEQLQDVLRGGGHVDASRSGGA